MLLTPEMTTPQRTGEQMAERRDDNGEDGHDGTGGGTGAGIATKTRANYTPMEFVVLCLQRFFRMDMEAATRVMLHVHQKGVGVCGTFSYEVAETKVSQVMDFAKQNQHPLQCTLEKA
jgi:ATP-dependent Clp protease adaptor protein ClpS